VKLRIVSILSLLALLIGVLPLFAQSDNECEVGFRPFVDVTGVAVCVPNLPERIVAIHDMNAGAQVLALGGPLVGLASRVDGFRADVTRFFDLEGIVDVGNVYEPNLERILELQPDLIVHEGFDGQVFLIDDDVLASLRAIAPVVAIDPFRPVEDVMADYQELLGEAATLSLEEQQETFEALLMNIRNLLGEDWQSITVSFVNASADGSLQAWGTTALVPLDILTRVGVNWVAIQQEADLEENGGLIGSISMERINEFNADLTLVDVRFSRDILEHPLYQQLTAVRAGQVILLDEPFNGTHYPNYIAVAQRLLSDLTALGAIDPNLIDEPESATIAQEADDNPFPVTVEHKFGVTTITQAPQRVVAIGYTEQDFLLALGVQPVAVRYWYGDETNAIFPWAMDAVEVEPPLVLNMPFGNLNYEAILALQPDLISAVTAGLSEEEYMTLSQIAPTVAQSGDYIDFGMPWQAVMRMVGAALGQSAEAEAIIAETEAMFSEALTDNPQFAGKTVAVAYLFGDSYGFYTAQDSRARFFTDLGFVVPDELVEIVGESFYANISLERFDLFDQDLIAIVNLQFIEGGRETLEADPLFSQLTAVQEGRVLYLDETAENALGFSSPLSLAYALDAVLPQLVAMFPPEPEAELTATITP
jgi:iron complex transport system substrate-binding protein